MSKMKFIPLAVLALSITACGGTKNRGLETVHQPVVTKTHYTYDVPGGMSGDDARRLADWFASLKVGYGDRISIDDPDGNLGARDEVAAIAARFGLLIDQVAPITQGALEAGSARVVVSRTKAEVPGCPDWSRSSQPEFGSNAMSNYGCATNSNLAAMVANPEDLLQGRTGSGPSDSDTSNKAIKSYRTAPPTGLQGLKNQTTKGGQ
jgi:pilus assembly protein CpaD